MLRLLVEVSVLNSVVVCVLVVRSTAEVCSVVVVAPESCVLHPAKGRRSAQARTQTVLLFTAFSPIVSINIPLLYISNLFVFRASGKVYVLLHVGSYHGVR